MPDTARPHERQCAQYLRNRRDLADLTRRQLGLLRRAGAGAETREVERDGGESLISEGERVLVRHLLLHRQP